MSEEELKYYNSLSRGEKISYTIKHKSKEEKEIIEAKRQKSRSEWSEEYKQDVYKRQGIIKDKELTSKKLRDAKLNRTEEEKIETNKKISDGLHKYFTNRTKEEKENFSKIMSEAYNNLSDQQKIDRVKKGIETKIREYGEDYATKDYEKGRERLISTNMNKYGVPYYCMTEKCKNSMITSDSKPNLDFAEKLLKEGLSFEREFTLGNYVYDFKINNILIEINPTATHNINWSPFNKPLSKDYHYLKSKNAWDNGYKCICIWDWDNINIKDIFNTKFNSNYIEVDLSKFNLIDGYELIDIQPISYFYNIKTKEYSNYKKDGFLEIQGVGIGRYKKKIIELWL